MGGCRARREVVRRAGAASPARGSRHGSQALVVRAVRAKWPASVTRLSRGTSLSRWVPSATEMGWVVVGPARCQGVHRRGGALTGRRRWEHVVETWPVDSRSTRASGASARMHDRPRASLLTPAARRYSPAERRQTRDESVRDPVCCGHPFGYCGRPLHLRRYYCVCEDSKPYAL
jgi:hypothetical protein